MSNDTTQDARIRQYKDAVRCLTATMFGLSEEDIGRHNTVWRRWLREQERFWRQAGLETDNVDLGYMALCQLVQNPAPSNAVKSRALAVLLAPNFSWSPFPLWKFSDRHVSYLKKRFAASPDSLDLKTLHPELLRYVGALVRLDADTVGWGPKSPSRPDLFQGIPVHQQQYEAGYSYNNLILQLLALLPATDQCARELFGCYWIEHPAVYPRNLTGREPFYRLLHHPRVPEEWKRLADEQVRSRIMRTREEEATNFPFGLWSGLLQNYVYDINYGVLSFSQSGGICYSGSLLAVQLDFVLRSVHRSADTTFTQDFLSHALKVLQGDAYADVRWGLAKRMLCQEYHTQELPLRLGSEGEKAAVMAILEEFGTADPELRMRGRDLLTEYAGRRDKLNRFRESLNRVVSQMR